MNIEEQISELSLEEIRALVVSSEIIKCDCEEGEWVSYVILGIKRRLEAPATCKCWSKWSGGKAMRGLADFLDKEGVKKL